MNSIAGMLAHIHLVKDRADVRAPKLKREKPSAARELYRKFLFYANFVALDRPVIVPEGKTDVTYLRCAIRRLTAYHPRLGSLVHGKFKSAIRLINYSPLVHEILDLGRGVSQLRTLIEKYDKSVSKYGHAPLAFPVIVLVDNDDGGKSLFGLVKAKSKVGISHASSDPFYYLGLNLYLIKTPEQVAPPHTSCMETCFPTAVLETKLGGKTFDPDKEHDEPGKYGKTVFASKVVEAHSDTIDFSGFAPLLDRIVAVLDHHAALKAAPPAAAVAS